MKVTINIEADGIRAEDVEVVQVNPGITSMELLEHQIVGGGAIEAVVLGIDEDATYWVAMRDREGKYRLKSHYGHHVVEALVNFINRADLWKDFVERMVDVGLDSVVVELSRQIRDYRRKKRARDIERAKEIEEDNA